MNTQATSIELEDPAQSGVFLVTDVDLENVARADHPHDTCIRRMDLSDCADKKALLDTLAEALEFPSGLGRNWDALADNLRDLSWLPAQGYVLLLSGGEHLYAAHPHDFDILLDILDEACASWAQAQIPFFGFVSLPLETADSNAVDGDPAQARDFHLHGDYVALNQLLKLAGICDSGGAGKARVANGEVQVDGQVETRKTCKIRVGQTVTVGGHDIRVVAEDPD